jgi:predicted DNA-binding ribbon-helix-helix protein
VATIDSGRSQGNLSSAIRLFVLDHYRGAATQARAQAAGERLQVASPPVA